MARRVFLTLAAAMAPAALALAEGPCAGHRIGLALSGGGSRGFAHVGVLRALEAAGIRPHAIAGTSMGAVVGGLYAMGMSPGEIEQWAGAIDWKAIFENQPAHSDLPFQIKEQAARHLFSIGLSR